MDLKDFIANFSAQFEETEISEFQSDTHFHNLEEWSSLMALSIIAMADEEYDVQLKGVDINDAVTIEDLYNVIKSKK